MSASHDEVGERELFGAIWPALSLDFAPSPWLTTVSGTEAKTPGTTTTTTHGTTILVATILGDETRTTMEMGSAENSITG